MPISRVFASRLRRELPYFPRSYERGYERGYEHGYEII